MKVLVDTEALVAVVDNKGRVARCFAQKSGLGCTAQAPDSEESGSHICEGHMVPL